MNFQRVLKSENNKSETIFDNGILYVKICFVDYDYTNQTIVYFVSSHKGDEFGQFNTASEAIDRANELI